MTVYIQKLAERHGPFAYRILAGPVHHVRADGALASGALAHVTWCDNYTEAIQRASLASQALGGRVEEYTPAVAATLGADA
jgi:hypothetical protein